jgi:hypothetical protein
MKLAEAGVTELGLLTPRLECLRVRHMHFDWEVREKEGEGEEREKVISCHLFA